MAEYWEISTRTVEVIPATFFKALPKYFPDATTFVAELERKALTISEVKKINHAHEITGEDIPERLQTFFSNEHIYRFSSSLMEDLARLFVKYLPIELTNTIYLFKEDKLLLKWHHALYGLGSSILVTADINEDNLSAFVHELGLTEWERVTEVIPPFEKPPKLTGIDRVVDKVVELSSKLGCLIVVLLFLWLIVARGCSQ